MTLRDSLDDLFALAEASATLRLVRRLMSDASGCNLVLELGAAIDAALLIQHQALAAHIAGVR